MSEFVDQIKAFLISYHVQVHVDIVDCNKARTFGMIVRYSALLLYLSVNIKHMW